MESGENGYEARGMAVFEYESNINPKNCLIFIS